MKYKSDLDLEVAFLLQVPLTKIRTITNAFIESLVHAIAENGEVDVGGLGIFRIRTVMTEGGLSERKLMKKRYVRFSKGGALKRTIEEAQMEKYGVDETTLPPESFEKAAERRTTCPQCGTRIERHGRILKCPRCGTEPFEE